VSNTISPLVSNRLFSWCCDNTVGNVTLHGFGRDQTIRAPLANLSVCLSDGDCDNVHEIPIVYAVTDLHFPDYDVILPIDVVRNLQAAAGAVSVSECFATDVCDVTTETEHPDVEEYFTENVDSTNQPHPGDSAILAQEQKQDPTLALCWVQAQAGKSDFVIHNNLLSHAER